MDTIILFLAITILLIIKYQLSRNNNHTPQQFIPRDYQNGNTNLILEFVDNKKKIIAIKELRQILNINLRTCKHIINNTPILIIKNISEEQARHLQENFNSIGVKVSLQDNIE